MMIPKRSLKIGTFNVRGLKAKEHLIYEWILEKKQWIAALTETWITPPDDLDPMISEYTALPLPYSNGNGYGGVALCISLLLR